MKRHNKILIAVITVVAILSVATATSVLAKPSASSVPAPTTADYAAWGCPMFSGDYTVVAKLLGMTTQDIQTQLGQGKTLVEIAATKGISSDKLIAAILDPMKQIMQQQVTSGVWTQAQMDVRLKLAEQHISQAVNAKGGTDYYGGCGGMGRGFNNGQNNNGNYAPGYGGGMMGGGMMGRGSRSY